MRNKKTSKNASYQSYLSVGKSLPPEELKEFTVWVSKEIDDLNRLKQKPMDSIVAEYAMLMWVCKKYEQMVSESLDAQSVKHSKELVEKKKQLHIYAFATNAVNKLVKRNENLSIGRPLAVAANIKKSRGKSEPIVTAINDLYKNGRGWQMNYSEIAAFLIERKISPYTLSTTLSKVKKITPTIKRKHKSGQ